MWDSLAPSTSNSQFASTLSCKPVQLSYISSSIGCQFANGSSTSWQSSLIRRDLLAPGLPISINPSLPTSTLIIWQIVAICNKDDTSIVGKSIYRVLLALLQSGTHCYINVDQLSFSALPSVFWKLSCLTLPIDIDILLGLVWFYPACMCVQFICV